MAYRVGLYEKAMPGGLGVEGMLKEALEAGYDHLELSVDESDARLARLEWTKAERDEAVRAQRAVGLGIRTMCLSGHRKYPLGSPEAGIRARSLEIMEKAIQLADALGIRVIQLAGYDVYYGEGNANTRAWFRENLHKSVEMAQRYGVLMGFETMETPFMDTVGKAMGHVVEVGSPYLGVYPDLGNLTNAAVKYGGDVYADLACGRGHLLAMHLKETRPGQYRDMEFGQGHVDFVQGIRAAQALGIDLFVTEFWHDGRQSWRQRLRQVRTFIQEKAAAAQRPA